MLRFFLGATQLDRIRNETVRGTAKVRRFGDEVGETKFQYWKHSQERE